MLKIKKIKKNKKKGWCLERKYELLYEFLAWLYYKEPLSTNVQESKITLYNAWPIKEKEKGFFFKKRGWGRKGTRVIGKEKNCPVWWDTGSATFIQNWGHQNSAVWAVEYHCDGGRTISVSSRKQRFNFQLSLLFITQGLICMMPITYPQLLAH